MVGCHIVVALSCDVAVALTHVTAALAVWSLGCLLFAMAFGYSPFESAFLDNGDVKIIECTYLAVIGPVRFPTSCVYSAQFCDLIRYSTVQFVISPIST